MSVPVFINCRDRLEPLLSLLDYLERAGCERVCLIDSASSYPPLLEYYGQTPHEVVRLEQNAGPRALWEQELLGELGVEGPFVCTDPDIVPIDECPLDAIDYFAEILERYPNYVKAGFGLRIDDIPDHYPLRDDVLTIEAYNWERPIAPRLFEAPIDTTFALYRGVDDFRFIPALRTGFPYLARHLTWYLDGERLPEEERFYREHSSAQPWWSRDRRPKKVQRLSRQRRDRSITTALPAEAALRLHAPAAKHEPEWIGREQDFDPELARAAAEAWEAEPELVDESRFTPWAEPGWHSWNELSPEAEFCDFAASLAQLAGGRTVIETGVGHGFLTRRVAARLGPGQRLVCFEANGLWRQELAAKPLFRDDGACALSNRATPSEIEYASAGLCLVDSGLGIRFDELRAWWQAAVPGALVLVHDAGNGHPPQTPHARIASLILELGIPGVFLKNPRGAFLGIKPGPVYGGPPPD